MTGTAAVGGTIIPPQRTTTRGFNDMRSEDFFALMIAQLQAQDPMKPTDNQQLLNQMSSIRQMEQSAQMTQTLTALAAEQRFGATSGLIGHYVAGRVRDGSGNVTEPRGLVIGVRFERGNAILELHNGSSLPASMVEQVTLVENLPPDILAQLQQELGQTPPADGTDDDDDVGPVDEDDGDTEPADDDGASGDDGLGDDDAGVGAFVTARSKVAAALAAKAAPAGTVSFGAQARENGDVLAALLMPRFGIEL